MTGRRRLLAAIAACLTGAAAALADEAPAKKRGPPPKPPTIEAAGVVYRAVPWNSREGLGRYEGYVAAVDKATGQELWLVRVYSAPENTDIEADKRDVFISRLALGDAGRSLLVTDERGRRYRIDLATHAVTRP